MYTLYWEQMAGSIVAQAVLEAIGARYVLRYVDMAAREHRDPAFLSRNPVGRIPALALPDGRVVGETAAICTFLGERHPEANITPQPGDADRGDYLFWISVMPTSGYATSSRVWHPEQFAETDDAMRQVKAKGDADFAAFFDLMEDAIAGDPFFLPRGLTALDFYLTMVAEWAPDPDALIAGRPRLTRLCTRTRATPAYSAAMDTHRIQPQTVAAT